MPSSYSDNGLRCKYRAAACTAILLATMLAFAARAENKFLTSVDAIQADSKIQHAFTTIEGMNAINLERLIELTEIPAPPFAEEARALEFAARIRAAGLDDVRIDEVGNVIARRAGLASTKTVALIAHLDTVFPAETEITVRREGNRFYAPGIGDNTRALVALLSLIETMNRHDIQTRDDIVFVGSVGEEGLGDLRGVRHLLSPQGTRIDTFIAMDGGGLDRLVVDAVGSNRYRIEFAGPGGHSYGAFGRAHPHQALAETITRFTRSAQKITRTGDKATFSVGRIGGGTSINSIPFRSWMEVDMRSVNPAKIEKLDKALRDAVATALRNENRRHTLGEPLTVQITSVGKRPAGRGDRGQSLIQNATAALGALGVEARLAASSSDANVAIAAGIPAVTISRGGVSKNAHSPDEYWENVDPHLAIQAALLLLGAEAGIATVNTVAATAQPLRIGEFVIQRSVINRYEFSDWPGKTLPVWLYVPETADVTEAPIVFMMHGAKRDAERYLKEWQPLADRDGFIVVAPEFSAADFPKSSGYNLGNMHRREDGGRNPESVWSFSAIEPIFDQLRLALKSQQTDYILYGHSAGSQFVHRYLYFKPDARVKRYIAANAGWYTLPNFTESYPYGLSNTDIAESSLAAALTKDVVVLLGDQDTDAAHKSLRRTPEAMRQGAHRFARGQSFIDAARQQAIQRGVEIGWRLSIVEGVAHSNGGMAAGATAFID